MCLVFFRSPAPLKRKSLTFSYFLPQHTRASNKHRSTKGWNILRNNLLKSTDVDCSHKVLNLPFCSLSCSYIQKVVHCCNFLGLSFTADNKEIFLTPCRIPVPPMSCSAQTVNLHSCENENFLYHTVYFQFWQTVKNKNLEKERKALSVVAYCEVVWLRPQDLHDALIKFGLLLLQRETKIVFQKRVLNVHRMQLEQCYQLVPMTQLPSAECWAFEGDRWRKK